MLIFGTIFEGISKDSDRFLFGALPHFADVLRYAGNHYYLATILYGFEKKYFHYYP